MITTADMKAILATNLDDRRILAIQLFLTDLIERETYGDGIERYRIKNTTTDTYITSLADFIAAIDASQMSMALWRHNDAMGGDRTHPTAVTLGNFVVEFSPYSQEDAYYTAQFGSENKHILFLVNYLSDGDDLLPLKIFTVRLV